MNRFIFFSKTNWDETPRLRHQMAYLLKSQGHEIIFFQKPRFFWQKKSATTAEGFFLEQTVQLIHHQLRVFKILADLNARQEKQSILSAMKFWCLQENDVILNFNYDYYFLREIFPKNKIITVINDDFVAQAKFFGGGYAYQALTRCLSRSDSTLVVSYPLERQASVACRPHLFFPWSDSAYKDIERSEKSKSILLWAHIDGRIDFSLIDFAAERLNSFQFWIVGPVAKNSAIDVAALEDKRKNIRVMSPHKLDELSLGDFFVSIIPYKKGIGDIEAVTMSNKSLQLMARGLPLVTYGMPYFYEHPAIKRSDSPEDFARSIEFFYQNFESVQPEIKKFVNQNGPIQRYHQLMEIVNNE